jgi:hypothetical protein
MQLDWLRIKAARIVASAFMSVRNVDGCLLMWRLLWTNSVTPHAYRCERAWLVPHCDVLDCVDKLWAEKRENALNHVLVAVVLFVIVGSTIKLLLPDAITVLLHVLHVGSASH